MSTPTTRLLLICIIIANLISVGVAQLYQNILADPFYTQEGSWNSILQHGGNANFYYNNSGLRVDILNVGVRTFSVQIENNYQLNLSPLSISSTQSYFFIAEMKTNTVQHADLDSGPPSYTSITGGTRRFWPTPTWANYSFCFTGEFDDTTARVVLSFGQTSMNPSESLFIRYSYLIPVASCATTSTPQTTGVSSTTTSRSSITTSRNSVTTSRSSITTSRNSIVTTDTSDPQDTIVTTADGSTEGNIQSSSSENSDSSKLIIYISVGVVGGILLLLGAIILTVFLSNKRNKNKRNHVEIPMDNGHYKEIPNSRIASASLMKKKDTSRVQESEINYDELIFLEQIGSGAFGIVYKGQWRHQWVAIKKLKSDLLEDMKLFREETNVMLSLRPHKNVLLLLGICSASVDRLCIVTEFCVDGSIDSFLRKGNVSNAIKKGWIIGIAAGMSHLSKEGVVHRDLSARNVLLDGNTPKIADFGLSRVVFDANSTRTTTSSIGPLKWMAPESISNKEYSQKSDAWMFGCTCFEIIFLKYPYPNLTPVEAAVKVVEQKLTPTVPPVSEWGAISEIMKACFRYEPWSRPNFDEICSRLEESS